MVLLGVRGDSSPDSGLLRIEPLAMLGQPDLDAHVETIARLLSINEEIQPLYDLMSADPTLDWLARQLQGLRRTLDPTPFEGLVSSIFAQLISIRGAAVIRGRFVAAFGDAIEYEGERYWAFPHPEQVVDARVDQLCGLGMTQVKARAIQTVAKMTLDGELDRDELAGLADEDVMGHLITIPGVGPWTAEWFLINVLGRMTVVPAGDLGVRRSTGRWLGTGEMPTSAEVKTIYAPFGDLRAYVAYYVLSAERYALEPFG